METFDEKTCRFDLEAVTEALTTETPKFVSNFYEWLTDGKMAGWDKEPQVPKTNITK